MSIKGFCQTCANGLQYLISFAQVEQWARIVGLVLSILISCLILGDKIATWWKKAKKDGKIDKEEAEELKDIVMGGVEEIKGHLDDKEEKK